MHKNSNTHGFLKDVVDVRQIEALAEALLQLHMEHRRITYLPDLQKLFPDVTLLINKRIYEKSCQLLAEPVLNLENVELHYMPANSVPIPCHQDNFYHCIPGGRGVKILIPLTELNPRNGALCFLDCDSSIGVLSHQSSNIPNFSAYIEDKQIKRLGASVTEYNYRLGDASYHLLNSIHFSNGNTTKFPTAFIVFRYQPIGALQCDAMLSRYRDCYDEHVSSLQLLQSSRR